MAMETFKGGKMNLKDTIDLMLFMLVLAIIYLISEAIADVIYKYLNIRSGAITILIFFALFSLAWHLGKKYIKERRK
ncbi:hypothetical protein ES705_09508 [subsurface metagenome]